MYLICSKNNCLTHFRNLFNMTHIAFLFHIFTIVIGGSAIAIGLLRFMNYRKIIILNIVFVLLGLELIMAGLAINLYGTIAQLELFNLSRFLDSFGVIFVSVFMPLIIAPLFNFARSSIFKIVHFTICVIIAFIIFGYYLLAFPEIIVRIGQFLFFSLIIVPIVGAIIRRKKFLGKTHFKRSLHSLFISLGVVLPFVLLDALGKAIFPYDVSVGFLMIVLCINAIRITWSDLSLPLNASYNDKIKNFCEKYSLTPREKEIVEIVGEGLTNREIGELLFISPKTVENHLSKIYSKTNVDNRFQLIQDLNR